MPKYKDIISLIGHAPLVKLEKVSTEVKANIYGKVEFFNPGGSIKDRIGLAMIEAGEKEGKISIFVTVEFSTRPDGLPALQEHYGFTVDEGSILTGAAGMSVIGLEERECEVGMVFGTDAKIAANGWHVYLDDKAFFPPYDITPSVRKEVLDKYPEIEDILNELVATFPGGGQRATPAIVGQCQAVWQSLVARVDIDMVEPEDVARDYLVSKGLID